MYMLAGLTLGLVGSLHCLGMCGPIALAIPVRSSSVWIRMAGALTYNLGRMVAYALIGLCFGFIGRGLALTGWQNALSISCGVVILLVLSGLPSRVMNKYGFRVFPLASRITSVLRQKLHHGSFWSLGSIGFLNGFLPCGLVYVAITASIATGHGWHAMWFMVAFGFGTFPIMMTLILFRNAFPMSLRAHLNRAVPYFVGLMAVLLILRGMNLGIPHISPSLSQDGACHHVCCTP